MLWEGCISYDEHLCLVERPSFISVTWKNIRGQDVNMLLQGLVARIFQHEVDHLNGELMWEETPESERVIKIPRILHRMVTTAEVDADPDKFYEENRKFIIEK